LFGKKLYQTKVGKKSMDRLATLQAMAREKPDDTFLIFALALEYKSGGKQAESRLYFERLVNEFPDYVATYYQYGKMEEENGNVEQAAILYNKGIEKAKASGDQKTARELQQAVDMMD
jgi:tetratricopeptide (TPR) repeat protein